MKKMGNTKEYTANRKKKIAVLEEPSDELAYAFSSELSVKY